MILDRNKINALVCEILISFSLLLLMPNISQAVSLTFVSDTISTSAPSAASSHTIRFTATNSIPPSGSIEVVFPNEIVIPAGFDFSDVDLAVATSTAYSDRTLAAAASASDDGVSVAIGTGGSITITLNSTTGINTGEKVEIQMGTIASYGGAGDTNITNPPATGGYRILITTYTNTGTEIDSAKAMIFIIDQVTAGPVDTSSVLAPPIRANGLPAGLLPSGTQNVEMSVETNENATCKYSNTSGVSYASSTNMFTTTGTTLHRTVITGLENDGAYSYYIRCIDQQDNENNDDYEISFSIGIELTATGGSTGGGGGSGSSSGGGGGSGSGNFLPTAGATFQGYTFSYGKVVVMRDGIEVGQSTAQTDGLFNIRVSGIERGTYTFGVYATDGQDGKTRTHSSTVSVIANTTNIVSDIVLSPIMFIDNESVMPGDSILVRGKAFPSETVEMRVIDQDTGSQESIFATTTTVTGAGDWEIVFDSTVLGVGTYELSARTIMGESVSEYSVPVYVGVGENPSPDIGLRADLNRDGKVNILDFSILLFHWDTDDEVADIDLNGVVNITDFSIMIFHWTG